MNKLNSDRLKKFLNSSLDEAKKIKDSFSIGLEESTKQVKVKNFQNEILTILDYMYTNFPVTRSLLGNYFPRPSLSENSGEYSNRIKEFKDKGKIVKHPKEVAGFLQDFYKINKKYQSAISYIQGKVKHETPNQFNEETIAKLDAKLTSNNPEPIQCLPDGGIFIGGLFLKGNVKIKDSILSDADFSTHIESLEFREIKITGDKIIFNNGIEFKFNEWATNCINICEKSFENFIKM